MEICLFKLQTTIYQPRINIFYKIFFKHVLLGEIYKTVSLFYILLKITAVFYNNQNNRLKSKKKRSGPLDIFYRGTGVKIKKKRAKNLKIIINIC